MTMEEEEVMEGSGIASAADLITYIKSMNREELVEYLEQNLEDEVDPQLIRDMTDQQVEEYKRLFIAAMTLGNDERATTTTTEEVAAPSSHEQKISNKDESPETEINYNITIIEEARLPVTTESEIVNSHKEDDKTTTMKMTTLKEQISKRVDTTVHSVVNEIPPLPSSSFASEINFELPTISFTATVVSKAINNTTMTTLKEQMLKQSNNKTESTPIKPIQHSSWSTSSSEEEVVKVANRPRVVYNSNGVITQEPGMIEVIVLDDDDDPADGDDNNNSQRENRDSTRGPCFDVFSISSNVTSPRSSQLKLPRDIFASVGAFSCRDSESVEKKIARWTELNKIDQSFQLTTSSHIPEDEEQEVEELNDNDDHSVSDHSGDLTSDKSLNNNRISCDNPDAISEYCGAGLLSAKIRMGSSNSDYDPLQPIFDLESGGSYDRQSFKGKCNICNGELVEKETLAAHVKNSVHRRNLMDLSLKLIGKQQQQQSLSKITMDISDHKSNGISSKRGTIDTTKENTGSNFENEESNLSQPSAAKKSKLDLVTTLRIGSLSPSSSRRRRSSPRKHGRKKKSGSNHHHHKHYRSSSRRSECSTSRSRSKTKRRARSGSRKQKGERRKRSRSMSPPPRGHRKSPPARYRRRRTHSSSLSSISSSSSILKGDRSRYRRRATPCSPLSSISSSSSILICDRSRRHSTSSPRRSPSSLRPKEITLQDKIDAFLKSNKRRSHSTRSSSQDKIVDADNWMIGQKARIGEHAIFQEKLRLQAHGKWSNQLEDRWKKMVEEQEEVKRIFIEAQNDMMEKLQSHPVYDREWKKFWGKRYEQLVKEEGESAEYANSYDYTEEWEVEWEMFTRQILQDKYYQKILPIRVKHGMDLDSLTALHTQSSTEKTINGTNNGLPSQLVPSTSNLVVVNNLSGRFLYSFSPLPSTPPAPILRKF